MCRPSQTTQKGKRPRRTEDFLVVETWLSKLGRQCVHRFKPEPIPPDTQLAICLYRLAHGCIYSTVGDLFGVAESTASVIFNQVCKILVSTSCDRSVYLSRNSAEWKHELESFLENWEFPCVGAWDGFHVYVSTKLKN